jgi:hypothetical protein
LYRAWNWLSPGGRSPAGAAEPVAAAGGSSTAVSVAAAADCSDAPAAAVAVFAAGAVAPAAAVSSWTPMKPLSSNSSMLCPFNPNPATCFNNSLSPCLPSINTSRVRNREAR